MIYNITGRMIVGTAAAPITAIDGTGGVELKSVEGRRFAFDVGFKLVIEKDLNHHKVRKLVDGPGVLAAPLHGASNDELATALHPLTDDGEAIGPGLGAGNMAILAVKQILILPTDPSKRTLYLKEAQVHPETQKQIRWDPETPVIPELCQFLASSEDDGSGTPAWWYAPAAEIATLYSLGGAA